MENAAQASSGQQAVVVELDREGERWRLQVRDRGEGMTAEAQANAFEFGFCHKEGRIKLRLGLPYAKHVMEQIGGEVRIASTPGQGTTVSLVFPRPSERIQRHAD
jgi:signal transduction histidine kinase